MNETVLTTIAVTGFSVAFFHAAIPTHWLPFVAAGRAQGWTHSKTLIITALAGTGHILTTAVLGFFLTVFGVAISARIGPWFPRIAGGILIGLGVFYIARQLFGRPHTHLFSRHHHHHAPGSHHSSPEAHFHLPDVTRTHTSDRIAILSLFTMLTISPCEGFLPIYVSGIRFGWTGFALLTAILSTAAVAGMLVFTWLALTGIRRVRLHWFEQYESLIMGVLLSLVGVLVMFLET